MDETLVDRQAIIDGLRKTADLLEKNEHIACPSELFVDVWLYCKDKAQTLSTMAKFVRTVGKVTKKNSCGTFYLTHNVTPMVKLRMWSISNVCERRQVGTRHVEAKEATEARDEPTYEYHCPSVLGN